MVGRHGKQLSIAWKRTLGKKATFFTEFVLLCCYESGKSLQSEKRSAAMLIPQSANGHVKKILFDNESGIQKERV